MSDHVNFVADLLTAIAMLAVILGGADYVARRVMSRQFDVIDVVRVTVLACLLGALAFALAYTGGSVRLTP
ncbi:hypothetical protein KOI35_46905 [Actinoplanes bogorensis]|uniref:Uncharacterized protein n=1 Tax=Paractinoplanes bogorensis TaxID=1610840 RepID=A0ABS5Z5T9_9ACTN|nr:hypothetical protein [Actinoplanes bogorensis]MBU2671052.1 hypothetical protein [Actinoplanes bogorensis]